MEISKDVQYSNEQNIRNPYVHGFDILRVLATRNGNLAIVLAMLSLSACVTDTGVHNTAGRAVSAQPLDRPGLVSGVGIEAQDITMMSDKMVRSMLQSPALVNSENPPHVIVDDADFENEGSQRINKRIITNKLRTDLNRAAKGRLVFVGRHYANTVKKERDQKRDGSLGEATRALVEKQAGADFKLGGFFDTLDMRSPATGNIQRYNQLTFEMFDLESSVIVWSDSYEVQRAGREDIVYR